MEYEYVYKIRRKSDGMCFSPQNGWTKIGKAYNSPTSLLSLLKSAPIDHPEDIEILTFELMPRYVTKLSEWSEYANVHEKDCRKYLFKQSKFLFAVLNSNVEGKNRPEFAIAHTDGWFNIDEVCKKLSIDKTDIIKITKFYMRRVRGWCTNNSDLEIPVFEFNDCLTKIRISRL